MANHLNFCWSVNCATWMTIVVPTSMTSYLYLYSHGEVSLAASQPAITFADFFWPIIFTSMSKVASIAWFEADSVCGNHSVAIPIVLILPYIFRFFQCLRQYKDTREKTALLNALKYSTAVQHLNIMFFLNSLYSFYWDITWDWDLSCFTRIFKFSKPHIVSYLLYGRRWALNMEEPIRKMTLMMYVDFEPSVFLRSFLDAF